MMGRPLMICLGCEWEDECLGEHELMLSGRRATVDSRYSSFREWDNILAGCISIHL